MKKQLLFIYFSLLLTSFFTAFAQTTPDCGGTFTDPGGPTVNYANNTDYTVTICPNNPGELVTVTFTTFNTEATWDALYVFNGNDITSPQISSNNPAGNVPGGLAGGFWGTTIPGPFTSSATNGCLTFRFRSDASVVNPGWIANVTCAIPPTCPRPVSTTATNITTNSAVISWLDNSTANSWEIITLPCGTPPPTATTAGTITTVNPLLVSGLNPGTCYTSYVRGICSTTDVSNWSTGATFTTLPTCPAPLQLNVSGITTSSVVMGWFETGSATNWEVLALPCGSQAPTATAIGTTTTTNSQLISGLNGTTCYNLYVRALCSTSDISTWTGPLAFTTLTTPPACGGVFYDIAGPNANYANNSDSTVTICPSTAGDLVTVTFTSFNTEATWDALYVFDGDSINSPQIVGPFPAGNVPGGLAGGFWGTTIPGPFTSTHQSGCLTFRFRSDGSVTNPGWVANVECSPPPTCPKPTALIISNGTINSVTLGWTNNSSATSWEVVALPCGTNPTATTTGTITATNPFTITGLDPATCYNLFVRAICSTSDLSLWSLPVSFTTLAIPPVCGGNFIDNGGNGGNYLPNSDSTVTICPTNPGEVVTVAFTSFNITGGNDALYVFDGNAITSPQIASTNAAAAVPGGLAGGFWGTTIPGPFTSTDPSGCLTFRFRSDNSNVNSAGWTSNVTCAPAADKILLVAFVDQDNNGIKDPNESLYANGSFVYQQNNTGSSTNAYSPTGRYSLYDTNPANTYDISYEVQPEYVPYYSAGTTSFNDVSIPVGSGTQILYFPITLTQGYNDVSVSIVSVSPPRPGLTYINRVVFKNLGITATSGTLTFTKPTPTAIIAVSQAGTTTTTTGFTYAFSNLLPNETRYFNVTLTVPSSPTVNLNDVLTATASITAPANDINLVNNNFSNSQIVVNSFDPNNKMEAHGDKIPFNLFNPNDYLTYTIRFQNYGTANAIDVRVEDVLSPKLDEESIRMEYASHNYTMVRVGNSLVWNFENIQLVPSSVDQDLSMGHVTFKIKMKPGFVSGDIVPNNASIYFDSNPAIVTNTFNTKFITVLGNDSNTIGDFIMYPNPTNNNVIISMQNLNETIQNVTITDILGKTVKNIKNITSSELNVDVSDVSTGIYLVEITTNNNQKITKKLVIN
jgi:uncharacterized repeat protein (TIGR01451 family)